ncbi:hypothetical protein BC830DRAFT_159786 [Chytriomyces sp. MP71]|nr:hypothetical protein BC830DRAFT_159786 [Chytriomyces sp. MP71]
MIWFLSILFFFLEQPQGNTIRNSIRNNARRACFTFLVILCLSFTRFQRSEAQGVCVQNVSERSVEGKNLCEAHQHYQNVRNAITTQRITGLQPKMSHFTVIMLRSMHA